MHTEPGHESRKMTMKINAILAVLGAAMLAGCATSVPQAQNFPPAQQKKVMAAQHWELIAEDAVERTRQALAYSATLAGKPVFVTDKSRTDFDVAFRRYMIAGFIKAGVPVSTRPEGAVEVTYDTQVIRHGSRVDPAALGYQPGMATAGVAGLWVLRNAATRWSSTGAVAGTIAAAAGYDAYRAVNPGETGVELLVSTTITHADRYVMMEVDAYYIEQGDAYLFDLCSGKQRRRCRDA